MKLALVSLLCLVCLVKAQSDGTPLAKPVHQSVRPRPNRPDILRSDAWCRAFGIGGHCCHPADPEVIKDCKADQHGVCSVIWEKLPHYCNRNRLGNDPVRKALCCPLCLNIDHKVVADPVDCSSGYVCSSGEIIRNKKKDICPDTYAWNEQLQGCIKDPTCTKEVEASGDDSGDDSGSDEDDQKTGNGEPVPVTVPEATSTEKITPPPPPPPTTTTTASTTQTPTTTTTQPPTTTEQPTTTTTQQPTEELPEGSGDDDYVREGRDEEFIEELDAAPEVRYGK